METSEQTIARLEAELAKLRELARRLSGAAWDLDGDLQCVEGLQRLRDAAGAVDESLPPEPQS